MDILASQISMPIGGVLDNPFLVDGFNQITSTWFPYSGSIASRGLSGATLRHRSNKSASVLKGSSITSYSDDYYHRIHLSPSSIDLGNVVSTQEVKLYVWNAHFTSKRLIAINGITEGLIVSGKQAPYTCKALEEQEYKLSVTPDGSSTIDSTLVWDFSEEKPGITVTGDRIVAFGLMPNWQSGINERLEWSTDILTSEAGFEQRSARYLTPRRTFTADFFLHAHERQYFNNMMSWGAKVWAIPLWPYVQILQVDVKQGDKAISCITKDIEFSEGGLCLLWRDSFDYEVAEILAINDDNITLNRPLQGNWSQGTRLYPVKAAYFSSQPTLTRKTDNLQSTSIEFFIHDTNPYTAIAPVERYLGYPVLMLRPDESEDLTSNYQRLLATLDNQMALPKVTDASTYSFLVQGHKWLGMGREQRAAFRALIYFLNGQQKALWIPSHADDLTVIDIVSATEPVLTIKPCGYTRFAKDDNDKKHIIIYLNDGSYYLRKIVDSKTVKETEQLVIDKAIGKQLKPSEISRICFIRLCRSNSDRVDIKHITDSDGLATSQLTFKRVRDNEL